MAPPVVSGRVTRVVLDRVPPALTPAGLNSEDNSGKASAGGPGQIWGLALAPVAVGQPIGGKVIQLAQPVPAFSQPRQVIVTGRAPTARAPDFAPDTRPACAGLLATAAGDPDRPGPHRQGPGLRHRHPPRRRYPGAPRVRARLP